MKKFGYVMFVGMMFSFIGWTFTLSYQWFIGTWICACIGWVVTKIDEERS